MMAKTKKPSCTKLDVKEIKSDIVDYFNFCSTKKRPPTILGLRNYLGFTKMDMSKIRAGKYDDGDELLSDIIRRSYDMIEQYTAEQLFRNGNTRGIEKVLERHFGWGETKKRNESDITEFSVNQINQFFIEYGDEEDKKYIE